MDELPGTTAPEATTGSDKSAVAKLVAAGILATVFVVFAIQNSASVEVDFLAWSFSIPQILLIVLSAVVGVVIWELGGFLRRRSKR